MKKPMYEVVFNVTETLQNGKERNCKKSVYMNRFGGNRKHITEDERIEKGIATLKELGFYNISYVCTRTTSLIFA